MRNREASFDLEEGTLSIPLDGAFDNLDTAARRNLMRYVAIDDDFLAWFTRLIVEGEDEKEPDPDGCGLTNAWWPSHEFVEQIRAVIYEAVPAMVPKSIDALVYLLDRERKRREEIEEHASNLRRAWPDRVEIMAPSADGSVEPVVKFFEPPKREFSMDFSYPGEDDTKAIAAFIDLPEEARAEIRKAIASAAAPPEEEKREEEQTTNAENEGR